MIEVNTETRLQDLSSTSALVLEEYDSTLNLYEGSEVELELTVRNDDTLSKKSLFYYSLGKKLYSKEFGEDGSITSEKVYHQDILGNNVLLTNANGEWTEKALFGPFGDEIASQRQGRSISAPNGYKFPGKERDKESDLDYFGARYLDYNNGRWMKPDVVKGSLFSPQTINRYVYVENNPVNQIDVKGYSSTHLNTAGQSTKYDMHEMNAKYLAQDDTEQGEVLAVTVKYQISELGELDKEGLQYTLGEVQEFFMKEAGISITFIEIVAITRDLGENWRNKNDPVIYMDFTSTKDGINLGFTSSLGDIGLCEIYMNNISTAATLEQDKYGGNYDSRLYLLTKYTIAHELGHVFLLESETAHQTGGFMTYPTSTKKT